MTINIRRQRWLEGVIRLKYAGIIWTSILAASCNSADQTGLETEIVDPKVAASAQAASMLRVADQTRSKGDDATAAVLYERILASNPNMTQARTSLAETLLDNGDAALALRYFEEAAKLNPGDTRNLVGAGKAYMAQKNTKKAREMFEQALQKEPLNVEAHNGLGVVLDSLKKHGDAQKHYLEILKSNPAHKPARNNYGLSLAFSGNHEKAVAELLPLTKEDGLIGRKARQNIALSYALRGDFVASARWAQLDLQPDEIRNNLRVYGSTQQED